MANSKMFLRNKHTGLKVFIAKYYPSTGWFRYSNWDEIEKELHLSDFGHLTPDEQHQQYTKLGFGPPYAASSEDNGEVWELLYE